MIWSETNSLQVGSPVTQALNIPRVEHKKGMIFVHQQRVLYPGIQETASADGWALKETRIHVFRAAQQAVNPVASGKCSSKHDPSSRQTPITLWQTPTQYTQRNKSLIHSLFTTFSRSIPCPLFPLSPGCPCQQR